MTPRLQGGFSYHGYVNVLQSFISPSLNGSFTGNVNGFFALYENSDLPPDAIPYHWIPEDFDVQGSFTDRLGRTYVWAKWGATGSVDPIFKRLLPDRSPDPYFTLPDALDTFLSPGFKEGYLIQQPDGKILGSNLGRVGNLDSIPTETLVRVGSELRWLRDGNGAPVGAPPRLWISFESGSDAEFQPLPGEMVWQAAGGGRWIYPGLPSFPGACYLKVRAEMPNGTGLFETPVHQFHGGGAQPPSADLQLTLGPAAPSAVIGDTIDLTFTVNNQPGDAPLFTSPPMVLNAPLPDGLTYVSHSISSGSSTGTYDPATGKATFSSLDTADSRTLTITAIMEQEGDRYLTANVVAPIDDPDLANNAAAVEIERLPQPTDLEVTLAATPTSGTLDSEIDFTLTVTNHGPGPAQNVRVAEFGVLSAFFVDQDTLISSVGTPGGFSWLVHDFSGTFNDERVAMPAGATETLSFTASPDPAENRHKNLVVVDVTSDTPDPELGNNRAEVALSLTDPTVDSDLQVTLTASDPDPQPGDTVDFTVTVENLGPDQARNVWVQIPLPAGYAVGNAPISPNPTQGVHYAQSDLWFVGVLTPVSNPTATLVIRTTVLPDGEYEFDAFASSHSTDPDPTAAGDTITIVPGESGTFPLELVSVESISSTHREITLQILHPGDGDPAIQQSTDLGTADPWSPVHDALVTPTPGQPSLRQIRITRPLTTGHLFFRAVLSND